MSRLDGETAVITGAALHAIISQRDAADLGEQARLARDFVDRFPT